MKRLWASGILLVLLLILCGLGYSTAQSSSRKMTEGLSRLRTEIYNGNYSTALAVSRNLQRQWEEEHRKLCTFMPHASLAPIQETLAELPALIQNHEIGILEARCSLAAAQFAQLTETETVTLDNVL